MNGETLSNAANSAKEYGQQAVDSAKQAVDSAKQYGSQAVDSAKQYGQQAVDSAKQYGQQARDLAGEYGGQAVEYGRSAAGSVQKTAAGIPMEAYLLGALGSIGISLSLKLLGRDRDAEFVGHWAPTFLTLGLLSKLIAHDQHTTHQQQSTPRGKSRR